ncbi:tetratricopeptide repeat protein [Bacteriovoracaceae bacterium]|nr:tetratricopeptide repeat protein [Bacteriovoracaceae bacterium]
MTLVSCSSSKLGKKETKQVAKASKTSVETKSKQDPMELIKKVDQQMADLAKEAKDRGEDAVTYLATDLFIKANDASMRGDHHTAVFLFKHIMALKPKDFYLKKKYAVELIRLGQFEKAKEPLEKVLKNSKHTDEGIGLILGGVYTALENQKEARSVYRKILKTNPKSEESCVFLSKSYGIEKNYKKAYSLLNACEKRIKGKGIFSYYKAKIAIQQNKIQKAKNYLRASLKAEPDYYQAALGLGGLYEDEKKISRALKVYKKFLKRDEDNYPILSRVVSLLFQAQQYQEVIPYAQTLVSVDPSDLNLKVKLGILYSDVGRNNEAKGIFKEILTAVPNSDKVLYYLGSLYDKTDEHEVAILYFSKIDQESSLFQEAGVQVANILLKLVEANSGEEKEKFSQKFITFIEKNKSNLKAMKFDLSVIQAHFYESAKNYEKAISLMEGIQIDENFKLSHNYYLASLYERVKNYEKSRAIVRKILEQDPDNAHALNFLGYSLLESGDDLKLAFIYIQKAVALSPNDGYIRDSLGWYYYKTGQYSKALKEVKIAFKIVSSDVVITKHLAQVYEALEQYAMAKKYYEKALANCKEETQRQEVAMAIERVDQRLEGKRLPASGK